MVTTRRRALAVVVALWAGAWALNRSLVAVRGPSMLPTLRPGERLLTVPVGAGAARGRALSARALRAGRVVVVEDPAAPGHLVVKRVARTDGRGPSPRVLVLGDNPRASTDGRRWGPLPATAVRRLVVARWPSLSRDGLTAVPSEDDLRD